MAVSVIYKADVNARIESFESMLEQAGCADIKAFLPDLDHPRYREILVELIRVDLEYGWRRHAPTPVRDYLSRFSILAQSTSSLQAICFEEYRQRCQAGESADPGEYQHYYHISTTDWPSSFGTINRALGTNPDEVGNAHTAFPRVGERFLGFQLERELGRGTFARVYLARQGELSERLVALKVSRARFSDSNTLARLQHTNIVPIYSVHRQGVWEAICMPFFGAQTLADLLRSVRQMPAPPASGQLICETAIAAQQPTRRDSDDMQFIDNALAPMASTGVSLTLQELSRLSYVEAMLVIGKKIAAGLEHAHERGIVHRDLKPANILLADDGEPMLLDFNLSKNSFIGKSCENGFIGGTLPYMAPEQLRAYQSRSSGGDARADLFSLGIILYELLTGRSPFAIHHGGVAEVLEKTLQSHLQTPLGMCGRDSQITPAVEAIVFKCLAPEPTNRYQSAAELADDIGRHLNNLPLRHVQEPSLAERASKWKRRHTRLMSISGVAAIACAMLLVLVSLLIGNHERLAKLQSQDLWRAFQQDLRQAQVEITEAPLADREQLEKTIATCVHALTHFEGSSDSSDIDWQWSNAYVKRLTDPQRMQLMQDMTELYFLLSTAESIHADFAADLPAKERQLQLALHHNQMAIAPYAKNEVPLSLRNQEQWLKRELGMSVEPLTSLPSNELENSRDLCQRACFLSSQRRFKEASVLWQRATMIDPKNIWVWYGLGHCLEQLKQPAKAAECFSACIALNPEFFGWFANRGRVRLLLNDLELARNDFLAAIKLKPQHADSFANLAISQVRLSNHAAAIASIKHAIQLGYTDSRGYLILARAYDATGESDSARDARIQADTLTPSDEYSWVAKGAASAQTDPDAAVCDFDQALQLNAHSLNALESKAHVLAERLERTSDAVDVLNDAVSFFPEDASLLASRGVLLARLGQREKALKDAKSALVLENSATVGYKVACIYALLSENSPSDVSLALELLAVSLRQGYGRELLASDSDLDLIRTQAEFKALVGAINALSPMRAKQLAAESEP